MAFLAEDKHHPPHPALSHHPLGMEGGFLHSPLLPANHHHPLLIPAQPSRNHHRKPLATPLPMPNPMAAQGVAQGDPCPLVMPGGSSEDSLALQVPAPTHGYSPPSIHLSRDVTAQQQAPPVPYTQVWLLFWALDQDASHQEQLESVAATHPPPTSSSAERSNWASGQGKAQERRGRRFCQPLPTSGSSQGLSHVAE